RIRDPVQRRRHPHTQGRSRYLAAVRGGRLKVRNEAEEAVGAIDETFGRHDGYRAVHAKGVLCRGTFVATPEAARLTRAPHMQGGEVAVNVRFSNASGNPDSADRTPDGRGMAAKFYLLDGARTDIVAVTLPCFFVRTPEDFVAFTRATKPFVAGLL